MKWHDGKPFSAKDVKCTWDALIGKVDEKSDLIRKNPRKIWYSNLKDVTVGSDTEVTFVLGRPQPSFLSMLAAGYSPVYACHANGRDMRSKPIGTGPFKVVDFKRNESIKLVRNPDYWKKGRPYLDAIDWKIVPNRSTRTLGLRRRRVRHDVRFRRHLPDAEGRQGAEARRRLRGAADQRQRQHPDQPRRPAVRQARAAPRAGAGDRPEAVQRHPVRGPRPDGAVMLPPPYGLWGMPKEMLETLPGFGSDVAKNRAEARQIMEKLGYTKDKPLKIKVATRNIAIYRDPAVILIDQLKSIYIDAELDPIDTTVWYNKIQRKDYSVGMNLTGVGVDDPDTDFYENFHSTSDRNYTAYKNPEIDALIDKQSAELDRDKRKKIVWEIEKKLAEDGARPVINHNVANTCWTPQMKGLVLQHNSIYNGWRFEDVWLDR